MNENDLTLHPHVMKLYRITYIMYGTDTRQTKMFLFYKTFQIMTNAY